jgi:uncharacterized protein
MSGHRVLGVALGTQALLIAGAWIASHLLGQMPRWGDPVRDSVIGLVVALALAAVNYLLLVRARANWFVGGVRAVYHELLVPLFSGLNRVSVIALGAAAGIGEEWLFRGVLQPTLGLLITSVLFGLAHVGGSRMLPFGVWAAAMGVMMGSLASASGGLIAPIVAHGVYDMLALEYIRRGAQNE